MFDTPNKLLLGLLTGMVFGFVLQKGRVAKMDVVVGQFLLRDWTVAKIMGTAIVSGSAGVHALAAMGVAPLQIKPALMGGVLVGAVLFGIGLAVFGYCPGTGVAACGEGHRDAWVGCAGMFVGAGAYVWFYQSLKPVVRAVADWGKATLPGVTATSPWLWVGGLGLGVFLGLTALDRSCRHNTTAEVT